MTPLLLLLAACGTVDDTAPTDTAADTTAADTRAPHILVIGVDGMRPDALRQANAPHMQRLMNEGISTWTGQTQLVVPPISGPGWATLLTGVDPDLHLVDSNDDLPERSLDWPTTPQRVHESGGFVSEVIDWIGILALTSTAAYDELVIGDDATVAVTTPERVAASDAMVWTHFNDVDSAGHATGFTPDNPDYIAEIEDVDRQVAAALDAVAARPSSERWMVALVTDHGGHGTAHDEEIPECRTIPMAVWYDGVTPRDLGEVPQRDFAPTVLRWMNLPTEGLPGTPWL